MYSFSSFEPVHSSMSNSNCFLTSIQVSQEAGKVVWYSHLSKNFPVCCDPHKGFSIINKAGVNVFLEFLCFFYDPADVGNLISGSSAFSKSSLNIWKFSVHENIMKRQKDMTLKDELPMLVGAQYTIGDPWRNNSRNNEE